MSPPVGMEIGNINFFFNSIGMPDYAVRLTHSYESCRVVVGLWAMRCEKVLVYEHIGSRTGKTHVHLALLGTNVDKKQLRNIAASTKLPVTGNEWCSFKTWDKNSEYITYMSKGQIDPKYNKGYEPAELEAFKSRWVEPHQFIKKDTTDNYLDKFDIYVFDNNCVQLGESMDFYKLKTTAKAFVYNECHQGTRARWDIKTINLYKMIMNTYIYEHGVKIPPDEKKWQW